MYGIISALQEESKFLVNDVKVESESRNLKTKFIKGKYDEENEIIFVKSGIGKVSSGACTQFMIDNYDVNLIILYGVAGAINKNLKVGDVIIGEEILYHDVSDLKNIIDVESKPDDIIFSMNNSFQINRDLRKNITKNLIDQSFEYDKNTQNYLNREKYDVKLGKIISGDRMIMDDEEVKSLHEEYQADCVEMEGAAVAHTCYLNDIPFIIIRSISDYAGKDANKNFEKYLNTSAKNAYQTLKIIIESISTESVGDVG